MLRELEIEPTDASETQQVVPPSAELSLPRITLLVLVLLGIAFGGWKVVTDSPGTADAKSHVSPVYAPYVDVTLTPTYEFQLPSEDPVSSAYLGFVVSDPTSACTPSWGGYYTLAQADRSLDLTSRIAQLRAQGGSAAISFGGLLNNELAAGCTSVAGLVKAYLTVIDRYHVNTIDFDLEGATLANQAANLRRAQAVSTIQQELAKQHKTLHVWLTLPVSDQGLTEQGLSAVRTMLENHVSIAGVNAMAMDFGPGEGAAKNMFTTVKHSLESTHAQVETLWGLHSGSIGSEKAWHLLGVTVMLGVNDITNEHFTTGDARQLAAFASQQGLPRVSVWSLNRDSECGAAFPVTGTLSNTCSGVRQTALEFTHIFSKLRGTRTATGNDGTAVTSAQQSAASGATDNPATSPYPIWDNSAAYVTGYKVVWQSQIYQANYWSQGSPPGPNDDSSTTSDPWLLIGPVPAGSHAFKPILTASVAHPVWSPAKVYEEGDRVDFDGLPYVARWYTKGAQPLDELPGNPSSAWEPLFKAPGEPADTGIGSGQSS